tara:strand:- start:73 stop:1509 length:1437 start_codon:yes stop_codon:yes gene_type:complete
MKNRKWLAVGVSVTVSAVILTLLLTFSNDGPSEHQADRPKAKPQQSSLPLNPKTEVTATPPLDKLTESQKSYFLNAVAQNPEYRYTGQLNCSSRQPISLWHGYRAKEKEALEATIAAYNKNLQSRWQPCSTPAPQVTTTAIPFDKYADQLKSKILEKQGPDIFIYAQDRLGNWASSTAILYPITGQIDAQLLSLHPPEVLTAVMVGDQLYGMPLNTKTLALIYNKKLLKNPPKTTSAIERLMRQKASADGKFHALAYPYANYYYHSIWQNGYGGRLFNEQQELEVDSQANIKALEHVVDWHNNSLMPHRPEESDVTTLFNEQRIMMAISGPWFLDSINEAIDYAIAPLPTISEVRSPMKPWMTVEGAYISANSVNKALSIDLLHFLGGADAGTIMATQAAHVPTNQNVYNNPEVNRLADVIAFRAQAQNAVALPNTAAMSSVWGPATTAMDLALRDYESPTSALRRAQEEIAADIKAP